STCLDLFSRSRDLRVSVALCLGLLRTEGLAGFRDGLAVLRGLIEKQWTTVHPKLDPEDNNDPLQRMNTLSTLSAPVAAACDTMRLMEGVREVPITNSRQIGRLPLGAILEVRSASAAGAPPPSGLDLAQIEAAFRDTPPEDVEATHATATSALEHLRALDANL